MTITITISLPVSLCMEGRELCLDSTEAEVSDSLMDGRSLATETKDKIVNHMGGI
jgi:hypothetical protein